MSTEEKDRRIYNSRKADTQTALPSAASEAVTWLATIINSTSTCQTYRVYM